MFTQPNDELLTTRAVMAMTGFKSRTTLYRRVKLNRFPQPREIVCFARDYIDKGVSRVNALAGIAITLAVGRLMCPEASRSATPARHCGPADRR